MRRRATISGSMIFSRPASCARKIQLANSPACQCVSNKPTRINAARDTSSADGSIPAFAAVLYFNFS